MHLVVTAGPTREYLDPVRFLSNGSSGLTGFLAAEAAAARGHRVTLVTGPVALEPPAGVEVVRVVSAEEMYRAVTSVFPTADAVVMTAAVCDYRPARVSPHKVKKSPGSRALTLVRTPDILAELGRRKQPGQVLIGFALEDRRPRAAARDKLRRKNLDAIVLNSPAALGSERNRVQVLAGGRWTKWPAMP